MQLVRNYRVGVLRPVLTADRNRPRTTEVKTEGEVKLVLEILGEGKLSAEEATRLISAPAPVQCMLLGCGHPTA